MRSGRLVPAIALGLALAGCARTYSAAGQVPARPGEEFALRAGQTAALEGGPLTVTFVRVVEESRCPTDVRCVRLGEAKVEFELRSGSRVEGAEAQARAGVVLATHGEPRSAPLGRYRVHLVRLDPWPTRSGPRGPYVATLRIDEA